MTLLKIYCNKIRRATTGRTTDGGTTVASEGKTMLCNWMNNIRIKISQKVLKFYLLLLSGYLKIEKTENANADNTNSQKGSSHSRSIHACGQQRR